MTNDKSTVFQAGKSEGSLKEIAFETENGFD